MFGQRPTVPYSAFGSCTPHGPREPSYPPCKGGHDSYKGGHEPFKGGHNSSKGDWAGHKGGHDAFKGGHDLHRGSHDAFTGGHDSKGSNRTWDMNPGEDTKGGFDRFGRAFQGKGFGSEMHGSSQKGQTRREGEQPEKTRLREQGRANYERKQAAERKYAERAARESHRGPTKRSTRSRTPERRAAAAPAPSGPGSAFQSFAAGYGLPNDELVNWEQDLRSQLLDILDHLKGPMPLIEWISHRVGGDIEHYVDASGATFIQQRGAPRAQGDAAAFEKPTKDAKPQKSGRKEPGRAIREQPTEGRAIAGEGDPIYEVEQEPAEWPQVENTKGEVSDAYYSGNGWGIHFRPPKTAICEVFELDLWRVAKHLHAKHGLPFEDIRRTTDGVFQIDFLGAKGGNMQMYPTKTGVDKGNCRINTGDGTKLRYLRSILLRSGWFSDAANHLIPTDGQPKETPEKKETAPTKQHPDSKTQVDDHHAAFSSLAAKLTPRHAEWLKKFPDGEFKSEELRVRSAIIEFIATWEGDSEATLGNLLSDAKILHSMNFMPKLFPLEDWVDRRMGTELFFKDVGGTRLDMLVQLTELGQELVADKFEDLQGTGKILEPREKVSLEAAGPSDGGRKSKRSPPSGQLHSIIEKILKSRGLPSISKGSVDHNVAELEDGQYQSTLTLVCLNGEQYTGEICSGKKEAQESACQAALDQEGPDHWGLLQTALDGASAPGSAKKQKTMDISEPIDACPIDGNYITVLRHFCMKLHQQTEVDDDDLTFQVEEKTPYAFRGTVILGFLGGETFSGDFLCKSEEAAKQSVAKKAVQENMERIVEVNDKDED